MTSIARVEILNSFRKLHFWIVYSKKTWHFLWGKNENPKLRQVFDNLKVLNLISISNLFENYKEVVKRFVGSCTKVADFFWKLRQKAYQKNSKTTTFMRRTEVYERYFLAKDSISNLFISFQISNQSFWAKISLM